MLFVFFLCAELRLSPGVFAYLCCWRVVDVVDVHHYSGRDLCDAGMCARSVDI